MEMVVHILFFYFNDYLMTFDIRTSDSVQDLKNNIASLIALEFNVLSNTIEFSQEYRELLKRDFYESIESK